MTAAGNTVTGRCEHCGADFIKTVSDPEQPQRYCSSRCRQRRQKKHQRWRRRARAAIEGAALCHHPYKASYASHDLAWQFIRETHPEDSTLAPYTCPCGAVHIGHTWRRA